MTFTAIKQSSSIRWGLTISIFCLLPICASAAPKVSCLLEYGGKAARISVQQARDALGGEWHELGAFKVRTGLSATKKQKLWLMVQVYANAADGDVRIISSQKLLAPFNTGRMEIVEPELGKNLVYECKEAQ